MTEIKARKQTRKPPTPLNTTAFTTDASSRLGITPARAMRLAEDLYMDGYVSYPRTDNTVYPPSLDTKQLVTELVAIEDFKAAAPLLDKPLEADARQEGDHRPPADLPDLGGQPEAPRGPLGGPPQGLRAGRPPLPRHLLAADDHRVDARRHQGRRPGLLRPRLGRWSTRDSPASTPTPARPTTRSRSSRRARSSPLEGDPELISKETQPPVSDLAGQADRDDGGARPRHQGDARRHHPEALLPRLRPRQPARAERDRREDVRGLQEVRAARGRLRDDRPARVRDGPDRGRAR